MFGLDTIFTHYQILEILSIEIEKQIGVPIEKYVMILHRKSPVVEFKINNETDRRALPNNALRDALMTYVESMIKDNSWQMEYAFFHYYKDNSLKKSGVDLHLINDTQERCNETTFF